MYANGAINIKLSILSNNPPCPGIKLLKSFIPVNLLILDAAKSPNCPIIPNSTDTINTFRYAISKFKNLSIYYLYL